MIDFITNPIALLVIGGLITLIFSKYIEPLLPEAKVISKTLKPFIGGLGVIVSRLFIFGCFFFIPFLFSLDFVDKYGYIEESHQRFVIVIFSYCVMLTIYLSFFIYVPLRDRIEILEKKIEQMNDIQETNKMKI